MGKDKAGQFHPAKGKPSGGNKEEGQDLRKSFEPDALDQDQRASESYSEGEDEVLPDVPVRHPNRNADKREEISAAGDNSYKSRRQEQTEINSSTAAEEMLGILTKDAFKELASHAAPVCVSILLPTHRSGVEVNEQVDMIAFKNALQEVENTLKSKTDGVTIKKMHEPGYELLRDDEFWRDLTEGLAIYIAEDFFRYLRLNSTVTLYKRVNSSFYVSPLVPFLVQKEYFYLLDLAKKEPRFYRVDALGIERLEIEEMPTGIDDVVRFEEKDGDNLFRTSGKGGTANASYHGIGGNKPDEKQHIAVYFDEVDDTIWKSHLHNATVPLLLSGIDYLLPIYRSVSDYKYIWEESLTGNHKFQSDTELYTEAMKIMQPYFEKNLNRRLEEYGNKSATELTACTPQEIVPAAYYGRVAQLFVRKNAQAWGTFDEAANKLRITGQEGDDTEDLVDKAVIKTIQNGGDVYLLEAERMPRPADIAAIFRY